MMTDTSDDPALIEQARHNSDAFAALYRRYLTSVYRYLYSRLGIVHDAEDITTQVFIDALEGLSSNHYRAGGCFSAWLFTIARRRLVDFYRQRPTVPLDSTRTGADLCEIPSAEPGLLVALEKSDDLKRLTHLLAQLDEEKQELLRLLEDAGFHGISFDKWDATPWQTVRGIEFRSATVVAFKGTQGACWEGNQAVIYKGPWRQVEDDDGHVLRRGERVAVCEKTFQILTSAPYEGQLIPIEPLVPPAERREFDCSRTVARHPRETKGLEYDLTTEASGCCAPGEGC